MENRIILITGPKHSGKTQCARALGKITGGQAIDLDEIIEKETGRTPRELFLEGPAIFRKAETLALERAILERVIMERSINEAKDSCLPQSTMRIIAAGGGLIDNGEALELIAQHAGIVIFYLDVLPETAWRRILDTASLDGKLPPFLDTENPKETHLALHRRRAEAYIAFADYTIGVDGKTPEEIALEIANIMQKIT